MTDRAVADAIDLLRPLVDEHLALGARVRDERLGEIAAIARLVCDVLATGGRVWTCGNGGSAADAQHLAAEIVGHFTADRRALPAVSLATDPSVVTAIANDFSFDDLFARQVEAHLAPGDLLVGFTTSGESENVVRALAAARRLGARTVVFAGAGGGRASERADLAFIVPSNVTARVQEMHVLALHLVSSVVDAWAADAGAASGRRVDAGAASGRRVNDAPTGADPGAEREP